jgi:plasmid maintenance system antidote protein VapI
MTPTEYMDAAKQRMGITSDYELARRLDENPGTISGIRAKKRGMPVEMAFRIAITLEQDPAAVYAEIKAQDEKDVRKREFWAGFLRRAAVVAALACTLALNYSATYEGAAATLGGVLVASAALLLRRASTHNLPLCRWNHSAL